MDGNKNIGDIFINRTDNKIRPVNRFPGAPPSSQPKSKKFILSGKLKKILIALFLLFFILFAGLSAYFYHQWKEMRTRKAGVSQEEIVEITEKIGKFMELPEGETPTMATVSDREKLKDQPFFAKAQNGDKVLIYTQSQKAILYRPAENKVIEVINLSAQNLNTPSSENPTSQ